MTKTKQSNSNSRKSKCFDNKIIKTVKKPLSHSRSRNANARDISFINKDLEAYILIDNTKKRCR